MSDFHTIGSSKNGLPRTAEIVEFSGDYTPDVGDNGKVLVKEGGGETEMFLQDDAGNAGIASGYRFWLYIVGNSLDFVGQGSATVNGQARLKATRQFKRYLVFKREPNTWEVVDVDAGMDVKTISSATYTFTEADHKTLVRMNNSGNSIVYAPDNANENIPIGKYCLILRNTTGGVAVSKEAGSSMQVLSPNGASYLSKQYEVGLLIKTHANKYLFTTSGGLYRELYSFIDHVTTINNTLIVGNHTNIFRYDNPNAGTFNLPAIVANGFPESWEIEIIQEGAGIATLVLDVGDVAVTKLGSLATTQVGDRLRVQVISTGSPAKVWVGLS